MIIGMFVCVYRVQAHACHDAHVEVRGQLPGLTLSSLVLVTRFQGMRFVQQAPFS